MTRHTWRRFAQGVIVVLAAFTISFIALYLLPSDPAEIMANAGTSGTGTVDPAAIEKLRVELGLDRPVIVQYLSTLGGYVTGDWGTSFQKGRPVVALIAEAVPNTVSVAIPALVLGTLLGCGIAFARALLKPGFAGRTIETLPAVAASLPTFWTGLVLIQVFAFTLRWVPPFGTNGPLSTVLPVATLAILVSAFVGQLLTRGILRAMHDQYAMVATAKGMSRLRLISRHLFRNAALPSLTMLGLLVGNLLAGAVVVETVFGRQGLGRLMAEAVGARDIPVVLGVVVFSAIVFVVVTFIVDLLYPLIDPRLRRAGRGPARQKPATSPTKESTV